VENLLEGAVDGASSGGCLRIFDLDPSFRRTGRVGRVESFELAVAFGMLHVLNAATGPLNSHALKFGNVFPREPIG
jgi:hypothetical protein